MEPGVYRPLSVLLTQIVGLKHFGGGRAAYGKRVRFRREPLNPRDARAIAVCLSDGAQIGYLPRRVSAWLAPVLDRGWIRMLGRADDAERDGAMDVAIAIHARSEIQTILAPLPAEDPDAPRHNMLADLWTRMDDYSLCALEFLLQDLREAMDLPSNPEKTRVLFHLIWGRYEQRRRALNRACRARIRRFLRGLRFGAPRGWADAALAPLFEADPSEASSAATAPNTFELAPLEGGLAGALETFHRRCPYPEGTRGYVGFQRGGFELFHWFERAEYARLNWTTSLLQVLTSSLRLGKVKPLTLDLGEHRRCLLDWWGGRHTCFEEWSSSVAGVREFRMNAGALEGHVWIRGESVARLLLTCRSGRTFLPARIAPHTGAPR